LDFMRNGGTLRNKLFDNFNYDDKRRAELRTAFQKEFEQHYGIDWYVAVQADETDVMLGLNSFHVIP
jgi:hypothetical protein